MYTNKQLQRFWHTISGFGRKPRRDPVCGMPASADLFSSLYQGNEYFFCSTHCQQKFEANPGQFVN